MADLSWKKISEIQVYDDFVWSIDDKNKGRKERYIYKKNNNGIKEIIQIELNNGKKIKCTPDHKIWAVDSWAEAGTLKVGDKVFSASEDYFRKNILKKEYRFSRVKKISLAGKATVYDISIWTSFDSGRNFICEGFKVHNCCYDEPPKRENRIACARGLTDYNGKEFFSMTLLKEPWIESEIVDAVDDKGNLDTKVYTVHTTMYDNKGFGLDEKGIKNFASKLTDFTINLSASIYGTIIALAFR